MLTIQQSLSQIIAEAVKALGGSALLSSGGLLLELPQDSRFGDLATNIALRLKGILKKPALETANALILKIKEDPRYKELSPYIRDIQAEGAGFINFYLADKYFSETLRHILCAGIDYLKADLGKAKGVLIEFVSANPTGPLSVAHARQAAVGDALAKIMEFAGFRVFREFYLNDEGNQINILGESVALRLKEISGEKVEFPENYYQGPYIYEIARQAREKNIGQGGLAEFAVNYILQIIKSELDNFGVRFDCWYSQKALGLSGKIEAALALLKERGFLYEKEGALWFSSSRFGDDKDRVVVKSDGSYTYLAPDIAYHRDKYQRGFGYLINLWGPDHHGYISRLKAAVSALGYEPSSLSVIIVQLATIFKEGKPLQMSTRKGEYITLREVLDEVGADAARFFFMMRRTCAHLDFDLELAKRHNAQNPVYYCQYAHARIASILRSAWVNQELSAAKLSLLRQPEELMLMRKLCQFGLIISSCVGSEDPYLLTVYLQELAESFHRFYDKHRVLGEEPQLSSARLALVCAVKSILAKGLELLGICRPDSM